MITHTRDHPSTTPTPTRRPRSAVLRAHAARGLWVAIVAVILAVSGIGAGSAAAAPNDGSPSPTSPATTNGQSLPAGMPAGLKKLVAGTPEFKAGPWFSGPCASKGGDMAAYLSALFPVENQMLYWRQSREDKIAYLQARATQHSMSGDLGATIKGPDGASVPLGSLADATKAGQLVDAGFVPPDGMLRKTFPNDNTSYYPSTSPVCANDLKRWTSTATTTWGFQWADAPDTASLQAMTGSSAATVDQATVGDSDAAKKAKRIAKPCDTGEKLGWAYCEHAYFVNCDQATDGVDRQRCTAWNTGVGRMFDGTTDWIDRNTSFGDRVDDVLRNNSIYRNGAAAVKAFSDLWAGAAAIVDFVKDPDSLIGKWANKFKAWAVDMTRTVLPGMAAAGEFDFSADWFVRWYAMSMGLGLAVLAALFLAATVRAARNGGWSELQYNVLGYLPVAVVAMLFAPMAFVLVEAFFSEFAKAITAAIGTSVDQLVNNVSATLGAVNDKTLIGGDIMAIIGFGLLGLGVFAMYLGLLMHQVGIPLASCAMVIGFAFFVYPPWRKKALRIPFTIFSLLASVPLLFFMLGIVTALMNSAAVRAVVGNGKLASLGQLSLMCLCFVVIGIAPFAMLKWAPILPAAEDADRMGDGGSGGAGQILGAGMGGAIGASRARSAEPIGATTGAGGGGQGAAMADHATSSAATRASGGGHGGGGGGHHGAEMGEGIAKGSKTLGKASMIAGPEVGAAGRLLSVAGTAGGKATSVAGHAAYASASGGTRAAAISASNRTRGIAADSAPTPDN